MVEENNVHTISCSVTQEKEENNGRDDNADGLDVKHSARVLAASLGVMLEKYSP